MTRFRSPSRSFRSLLPGSSSPSCATGALLSSFQPSVRFFSAPRQAQLTAPAVPCIAGAGYGMNLFMSEYRRDMLEKTAEGGTLAEEVISSVRNTHAFGTQKKLTAMYDVNNEKVGICEALPRGRRS